MAYRIDGHDAAQTHVEYVRDLDREGKPRRIVWMSKKGKTLKRTEVNFAGDIARFSIRRGQAQYTRTVRLPIAQPLLDDESLHDLSEARESLDYFKFDPASDTLILTRIKKAEVNKSEQAVSRFTNGYLASAWLFSFDADGALLRATRPLFGFSLRFDRASPDADGTATKPAASLPHQMVNSRYAIPLAARRGHIRYGFNLVNGFRFNPPATGEQSVLMTDGAMRIDVCDTCGTGLPINPETLDRLRRPSPWLQSEAPQFKHAVKSLRARKASAGEQMKALSVIARNRLRGVDYDGHYSALNAWKRGKGDCTEDAVVLAALARAAGIPAIVASGIVYSRERYHGARNAFLPHSWVIAFVDGKWRSYDISIGGFDATHIAMTLGDGEPEAIAAATQMAALLQWRDLKEVKTRPASRPDSK